MLKKVYLSGFEIGTFEIVTIADAFQTVVFEMCIWLITCKMQIFKFKNLFCDIKEIWNDVRTKWLFVILE